MLVEILAYTTNAFDTYFPLAFKLVMLDFLSKMNIYFNTEQEKRRTVFKKLTIYVSFLHLVFAFAFAFLIMIFM